MGGMQSPWQSVLAFWFGELDEQGLCAPETVERWWRKDPQFDATLRSRFSLEHAAIARGEREAWLADAHGRLAYVVVLDQFSRNMFRGTPGMFASDERALAAAVEGLGIGADRELRLHERVFLYMPLMHSERLDVQERGVATFAALAEAAPAAAKETFDGYVKYAGAHRDIVARFERFPHRNAILGRSTTPEEEAFLKQPGSSF
jgi:uncharacterized protein (DUF924 family)